MANSPLLDDTERDYSNETPNEAFEDVLRRRLSRRTVLRGIAGTAPLLVFGSTLAACDTDDDGAAPKSGPLTFTPVQPNLNDKVTVPDGYEAQVLLKWGDPLREGVAGLGAEGLVLTAAEQAQRFGYNADFVAFFPREIGSRNSDQGILAVNHEYTNPELMFVAYDAKAPLKEQVDVEIAAHGMSVVEVARDAKGQWSYKPGSGLNRRITGTTIMDITGPAARNARLKVTYEGTGAQSMGMLNNCGGGKTPWGTVLTAEENFNQYFANQGAMPDTDPRKAVHKRYGLTAAASERGWEKFYTRFDLTKEPNEPFRFGWVVEIDPYDATSSPKKRTALGRLKHEAATVVLAKDARAVVYTGDDERFDYMYKFVSAAKYNEKDRKANLDLLDNGTLYVAKFSDDGTGSWLPVVQGQGPLTVANGFMDQGDVLINTRGAADLLGATKMDRPEDIEANPVTGKVYAIMTNNTNRTAEQINKANPRAANKHGHIIEFSENGADPAALDFRWEVFIQAGDPKNEADGATYWAGFDKTKVSWLSCPDNLVFGAGGNVWIATDGQPGTLKTNDGIYVAPVEGPERGFVRLFATVPVDAECCGPEFTPDFETLFIAVQHPGEKTGTSTLANPTSRWPNNAGPPRPGVVAIVKTNKGVIGA